MNDIAKTALFAAAAVVLAVIAALSDQYKFITWDYRGLFESAAPASPTPPSDASMRCTTMVCRSLAGQSSPNQPQPARPMLPV